MYLVRGTNSYEAGFVQSYLQEKFDESLEVSNIYNKHTHKRLLQYIKFPEVYSTQEVIESIREYEIEITEGEQTKTYTLEYLFSIENNIDNILLMSKSSYSEELWLTQIANALFELKSVVYEYGWKLMYYIDNNNKFVSHLNPINLVDTIPRKELYPMLNLAGLDYIDNYIIADKNYTSFTNEVLVNPYLTKANSMGSVYSSLIYDGDTVEHSCVEQELIYTKTGTETGETVTCQLSKKFIVVDKEKYEEEYPKAYYFDGEQKTKVDVTDATFDGEITIKIAGISSGTDIYCDYYYQNTESVLKQRVKDPLTQLKVFPTFVQTLHQYFKKSQGEGGFGDEETYLNSSSFKFKLNNYPDGDTDVKTYEYIDSDGNLHDLSTFLLSLTSSEQECFIGGLSGSLCAKNTTSKSYYKNVVIQLFLAPTKNRLYLINDIKKERYYAISHAYDVPTYIKYAFSDEEASSERIKKGHINSLIGDAEGFWLNVGEVKIIKVPDDEDSIKSLFVQIEIPAKAKNGNYEIGTKLLFCDMNMNGEIDDEDLDIVNDNGAHIDKYSPAQVIALKNRDASNWEGNLKIKNADYDEISDVNIEDIYSTLNIFYDKNEYVVAGINEELSQCEIIDYAFDPRYTSLKWKGGSIVGYTQKKANIKEQTGFTSIEVWNKDKTGVSTLVATIQQQTLEDYTGHSFNYPGLNIASNGKVWGTPTVHTNGTDKWVEGEIPEPIMKKLRAQRAKNYFYKIKHYYQLQPKTEYRYTKVPQTAKDEYLYVGRTSDHNVNKFTNYLLYQVEPVGEWNATKESQLMELIKESYVNLNFNKNPFLVHTKFMDYLLDSAIHKYSEEERIKQIYDLVGYDESYSGYTEQLKDLVFDVQDENNITFKTGYPDVETLFILKEGT